MYFQLYICLFYSVFFSLFRSLFHSTFHSASCDLFRSLLSISWVSTSLSCLMIFSGPLIFSGCAQEEDQSQHTEGQRQTSPGFCQNSSEAYQTLIQTLHHCPQPWLPQQLTIHQGAIWNLHTPDGQQVDVSYHMINKEGTHQEENQSHLSFNTLGIQHVSVRSIYDDEHCAPITQQASFKVTTDYEVKSIAMEDPRIIDWADSYTMIDYGAEVDEQFRTADRALGEAQGHVLDVVSLGRSGQITLEFIPAIANGEGPDFAVFENSFSEYFLELAYVEVSSDGVHFTRFPNAYLGENPIDGFGMHEAQWMYNLAGQAPVAWGTPFDLAELAWSPDAQQGLLDLHHITHVRLIDIVGDGQSFDSFGSVIYDPYPTSLSAGFDLDAIAVLHTEDTDPCPQSL